MRVFLFQTSRMPESVTGHRQTPFFLKTTMFESTQCHWFYLFLFQKNFLNVVEIRTNRPCQFDCRWYNSFFAKNSPKNSLKITHFTLEDSLKRIADLAAEVTLAGRLRIATIRYHTAAERETQSLIKTKHR